MNRSFKEEGRKKEKKVLKRRNKKGSVRIKGIINKRENRMKRKSKREREGKTESKEKMKIENNKLISIKN